MQYSDALVHPEGAAEDHDEQNGGGSQCEPAGVGANVSGLDAADKELRPLVVAPAALAEPLTMPPSMSPPRKMRVNMSSGVTMTAL